MEKIISPEHKARRSLQDVARAQGSSLAELSRLIGRNPAYLQQYVTRGSPRHLDEPDLRKIAGFLGVAAEAIATRALAGDAANNLRPGRGWRAIPRLAIEVSAGPGATNAQEIPYDSFHFSEKWLLENGLKGADLSAIRVEGDSMEPLLRSGDEIFVDRAKRSGEGVFVVRIGDVLHVKRVRASGAGTIALVSENTAYAPIELAREEVEVIGRVVWKVGRV